MSFSRRRSILGGILLIILFVDVLPSFYLVTARSKSQRNAIKRATKREASIAYVMNAITCDICYEVSRQVLRQTDIYKELNNASMIPRYEVDTILEHICDPYSLYGAWVRQLRFHLRLADNSTTGDIYNQNTTVYFDPQMEETVTKCNRVCTTVRNSCEDLVDHVDFSAFSKTVSMLSLDPGPAATYAHLDALNETICQRFVECYAREKVIKNCNIALNDFNRIEKPRHGLLEDKVEVLPVEEFETEFRVYHDARSREFTNGFQERELRRLRKMAKKDAERIKKDYARRKAAASRRMLSKSNITSKAYAMEFLLPDVTTIDDPLPVNTTPVTDDL